MKLSSATAIEDSRVWPRKPDLKKVVFEKPNENDGQRVLRKRGDQIRPIIYSGEEMAVFGEEHAVPHSLVYPPSVGQLVLAPERRSEDRLVLAVEDEIGFTLNPQAKAEAEANLARAYEQRFVNFQMGIERRIREAFQSRRTAVSPTVLREAAATAIKEALARTVQLGAPIQGVSLDPNAPGLPESLVRDLIDAYEAGMQVQAGGVFDEKWQQEAYRVVAGSYDTFRHSPEVSAPRPADWVIDLSEITPGAQVKMEVGQWGTFVPSVPGYTPPQTTRVGGSSHYRH